jgi:hypothetical protein
MGRNITMTLAPLPANKRKRRFENHQGTLSSDEIDARDDDEEDDE